MMKKIFLIAVAFFLAINESNAQKTENSGWLFFLNSTKFNEKWGMHLDVQVRSSDDWEYVRNLLVRPGLTYFINKNNNVTLGYMLNHTYLGPATLLDSSSPYDRSLDEHRIWEQYIHTHKLSSIFATHRFRLEQRFIERYQAEGVFSQRFRYFFRLLQPLQKKQETFKQGAFVALQNEIFLNLQNNKKLNNSIFDQNRAYFALGYRFSPKVDIEAGYLNQAIHGLSNNTINNVAQVAIYTRF